MTDKQPEALRLADALDYYDKYDMSVTGTGIDMQAAALLRTQHAEIERLNACIKWEQNRAERIGTHGPGCEKWGSAHFECALRAIERKDALLRQALEVLRRSWPDDEMAAEAAYLDCIDAIKQELSQ